MVGCFWSCNLKNGDDSFYLEKDTKAVAERVKIDTVGFYEDFIYAKNFWVYQDSILVVHNRNYEDGYFLEFYELSENRLITKLFRYGNGPNELLSANVDLNKNELIVNDFVKGQVVFVDIDSLLQGFPVKEPIKHYVFGAPTAVRYKDDCLLLENPDCFQDEKLRIDNKESRFIVACGDFMYEPTEDYRYFVRNVAVDGRIITNYKKNRIFHASMHEPLLQMYDTDLNLLKKIKGPDNLPPDYRVVGNTGGREEVVFKKGHIPFTYLNFCANEEFFCLAYMGDYLLDNTNIEDYPFWIFKFDWDGNIVDSYTLGRYVSSISLSADGQTMYATVFSDEKNPFLIKFAIK